MGIIRNNLWMNITQAKEDKSVRQVALEMQLLPEEELARLLDLMAMTKPGL